MQKLKLAILAGGSLLVSTAYSWDSPARYDDGEPADARGSGSFIFNMGFNGRTRNQHRMTRQPVILHGVNFRFDSAELTPGSSKILDAVAGSLRHYRGSTLEVGGHASAEGDALYNLDLSARRARAVRGYLIKRGVPTGRLTSNGYGETRPLVDNASESGRSLNRRVELTPTYQLASYMQ